MKDRQKSLCIVLVASLIFSIIAELCFFTVNSEIEFGGGSVSLLSKDGCAFSTSGYILNENFYTQENEDPQLIFRDVNETVHTVYIKFGSRIKKDTSVQIYYAKKGEDFSAENATVPITLTFPAKTALVEIPKGDYSDIRVDINGTFLIEDILVSPSVAKRAIHFDGGFSLIHLLIFFAFISIALLIFVKWFQGEKTTKSLTAFELIFIVGCFIYYTMWIIKPINYGPDESMRYDVSLFFFQHNRLPIGRETANPVWGFSYALFPTMMCNILDYIPMKLTSLITTNELLILKAARMVSVCCATGTVYFIIKASKQIFETCARWIMIVLVAAIPQFAFLGSYVNNDICAMFGISIILYAWTLGIKDNWNYKNALLLSIGISVCALSYYNSYPWILCSIFIYILTYFYQNKKDCKGFIKLSAFIVVVTLALIGYMFIRHLYLYGDLLGFNVTYEYGELYGLPDYKPSGRGNPANMGYSLKYMLFNMGWLKSTYKSFIGIFGPMAFQLDNKIYQFYTLFFIIAILGLSFILVKAILNLKKKKPTLDIVVFIIVLAICSILPVLLRIYNSYNSDYQPQGRYCYPILPAVAVFAAKGFEALIGLFKDEKSRIVTVSIICTVLVVISVSSYFNVLLLT